MTRWQRLLRALGMAWRNPADCPHPKASWFWDDGCGGEPALDTSCRDCHSILVHGSPWQLAGCVTAEGKRAGL